METEAIEDLLTTHDVMPTQQRIEIGRVLLARPQHMSADQILDRLRERGIRVSKATIYNTLKLFSSNGLAREVNVDPSRLFYDSTTHEHHHFYNMDTGELADIKPEEIAFLNLPELPAGTEQESVEVLIKVRDRRQP